jgi:Acetyltransferase (GNAT) domain
MHERLDYEFITDWNSLPNRAFFTSTLSNSLLAGRRFFKILQETLNQAEVYYLGLYSRGQLVALVCVTEVTTRIGPLRIKTAICGNSVVSSDSAIFTLKGVKRETIITDVLRAVNEAMNERKVDIVIMKEMVASDSAMESVRYFKVPLEPVLGMEVSRWSTFEQYLGDMKSHYRGLISRATREREERDIQLVKEVDIRPIIDNLYQLFRTVALKPVIDAVSKTDTSSNRLATRLTNLPRRAFNVLDKSFFVQLQQEFPEQTDIITIRDKDELIGCTINLQDNDVFHSIYIGLKRNNYTPYIYRSLLAAKVQHAIQRGVRLMHFGRTCLESKANLGAVPLPEACYCNVRWALLNSAAGLAASEARTRQGAFVARNVFKQALAQTQVA